MSPTVRNVLVVVALAAVVALLPGGGVGAGIVSQLLFIAFATAAVLLLARAYRENRVALYSLGERHRGLLYGGLAAVVFCLAALGTFFDAGVVGGLAWFAILGAAVYALVSVYRHWREYV